MRGILGRMLMNLGHRSRGAALSSLRFGERAPLPILPRVRGKVGRGRVRGNRLTVTCRSPFTPDVRAKRARSDFSPKGRGEEPLPQAYPNCS